ncbi:MAU2 chromatid cohesion factor homolog isoform X1 [Nasonia vitripennis]|uniref:MAU2 chromatid cohesion factor homolog n=1 Tax=Nasonia vitripennis TaxID=7425 RepID=A0A7M7GBA7_NASVI|nr:MAU2 chromatid cohesion factor homolog isoform X1 [Nasonia vitripennis]
MASSQDAWYLSLLGLAENFRTSNPPSIKSCIQCLQAVFNFKPPPRVEARTHLQLGNILLTHTKNIDLARTHLERAWQLSQTINQFDDVKFEAASILAELYEQQQQSSLSQSILRKAIELSQHNVYWHCRLIFQLAQIHASEKDLNAAGGLLAVGADYSQISNANYTKVLFLLSRCMLLLIDKKFAEAAPLLFSTGQQVENWQGNPHQKEYLKVYFLVLQVCHNVMSGQVKSVKPCLKQLQQSIQTIMAPAWPSDEIVTGPHIGDMFIWMPKEHLFVLVYLVTVMHSMQSGYMDKAQKYTDKALAQIENLKLVENKPILSVFQLMLLEHIVMCRLVMGNKSAALSEISQACQLCRQQPKLLQSHRAQLHVLLGLYAMSMNCMQEAEAQLLSALNKSQENELVTFANLNLAIVYLRTRRDNHLGPLLERIKPETLPSLSHSLRAAAYYVQGLQAFFGARYNEAKRHLRETLKMANAEDLNRLTSCSLVLLGHIFLSLGNNKESMNMVTPAMQLASKIPDVHVQLWATAILKDLNRICNDRVRENEAYQMHCTFSQTLLKDHFQSTQMSEHSLIQWTEGPIPMLPNNSPASTSQAIL